MVRLGLGLIASLAIARALGTADFGTYSVLAATVGVVGALAEGGLTEAAVLRISAAGPAGERRARGFFWLRLGLAAGVVGCGCLISGDLSSRLLNGIDPGLLRWALLGIVATAASGAVSAMLQATGAFGPMSGLMLINTGLTAVLAVVLGVVHQLNLFTALVVLGIGTSLATFAAGRVMLRPRWQLRVPPAEELRTELGHLVRTGRWLWLAGVFAMLTTNAEVLLLNRSVALPLVGAYALALSLATKADVVNHSLYTVLLPGVGELTRVGHVGDYIRRGLVRSCGISIALLLLVPVAEPLIVLIYGEQFAQAAMFFRLLIAVMIFDVLLTPLLLLPLAYRRPKLLAMADGMRALTLIGAGLGLIPAYGAFGAILARFAARAAGAALILASLYSSRQALQIEHPEPAGVAD
jgi:O-antigen/teichoic acid export membrane protein